jgi:hypothetical protein
VAIYAQPGNMGTWEQGNRGGRLQGNGRDQGSGTQARRTPERPVWRDWHLDGPEPLCPLFDEYPQRQIHPGDWKWPSRCCCRSDAAGPMPAADPRRTMYRRQLLALQHACLHGFGCPISACARWHPSIPEAHINKTSPKRPN